MSIFAPLRAAALCLFTLAPAIALAQVTAGPSFKAGAAVLSDGNTGYEMAVSEDKQAGIVVFDGLEKQLDGIGVPTVAARVFSISLPLEGAAAGTKLWVFLEGYAYRAGGADISLITTVNGQPHVMDFEAFGVTTGGVQSLDCERSKTTERLSAIREKTGTVGKAEPKPPTLENDESGKEPTKPDTDGSFVQCIPIETTAASDVRINVVLALNRRSREAVAYLNVSSINLSVRFDNSSK